MFDPLQRYANAQELKAAFLAAAADAPEDVGASARSSQPFAVTPEKPASGALRMPQTTAPAAGAPANPTAGGPRRPEAPHVVGRIWNTLVLVAFVAICAYLVYAVTTGGFVAAGHGGDILWYAGGIVIDVVFFALFAFACLDKRRLRERFPALAGVRAWQAWVMALLRRSRS